MFTGKGREIYRDSVHNVIHNVARRRGFFLYSRIYSEINKFFHPRYFHPRQLERQSAPRFFLSLLLRRIRAP